MSHQEQGRDSGCCEHHQELHRVFSRLLEGEDLTEIQLRRDCRWTPIGLAVCAILWAWSGETTLGDRFRQAQRVARRMLGGKAVAAASYQAFIKLLLRWTTPLMVVFARAFQSKMESQFPGLWRIGQFVAFGADGSRFELPRTASNEAHFSPPTSAAAGHPRRKKRRKQKRNLKQAYRRRARKLQQSAAARAKKANSPQMWVTTIWHLGVGLPWNWRLGPSNSSEREHLKQMATSLPANSLIVADAGFYGYELWSAVLAAGHQILIRVGSNVRLLKKLGYVIERDGTVYCWPNHAASKSQPPLELRLVVVHNGKHPVYLVTSVVDEKQLSNEEIVTTYALRWGIEVYYRHVKQTFDRRKLRSHSAENALLEAEWSLLGLWAMAIHARATLQSHQLDPQRLSIAAMLRAYRAAMNDYKSVPDPGEDLHTRLQHALHDTYQRKSKTSRQYPRKKQEKAAGPPIITLATKKQVEKARELKNENQKGLTA